MRPQLDPEREAKYDAHIKELLANPPPELRMLQYIGADALGHITEIMKAGCWLTEELHLAGASEEEVTDLSKAHGQLCFGRDPWAMAVQVLDGYKAGRPEKHGPELAERIFNERVKVVTHEQGEA